MLKLSLHLMCKCWKMYLLPQWLNSRDRPSYIQINGSLSIQVSPEFSLSGPRSCTAGEDTPFTLESTSGWQSERQREGEGRKQKKRKLHHYNTIILLGCRLTTSKLAVLHCGRRRPGNTRGRHNEAVVMCTKTFLINNNKQASVRVTFKGHFHRFLVVELIELRDLSECDSGEKNPVEPSGQIQMKVVRRSQETQTHNRKHSYVCGNLCCAPCNEICKFLPGYRRHIFVSSSSPQVSALTPVAEPLIWKSISPGAGVSDISAAGTVAQTVNTDDLQ